MKPGLSWMIREGFVTALLSWFASQLLFFYFHIAVAWAISQGIRVNKAALNNDIRTNSAWKPDEFLLALLKRNKIIFFKILSPFDNLQVQSGCSSLHVDNRSWQVLLISRLSQPAQVRCVQDLKQLSRQILLSCSGFYGRDSLWYCPANCAIQSEPGDNHFGSSQKHSLSVLLSKGASSFRQGSCQCSHVQSLLGTESWGQAGSQTRSFPWPEATCTLPEAVALPGCTTEHSPTSTGPDAHLQLCTGQSCSARGLTERFFLPQLAIPG